MHPLKQLRKLVKESSPTQGKVMKVGDELRIATSHGSISVEKSSNDATKYAVGDTVILKDGQVVGRRTRQPTLYVL